MNNLILVLLHLSLCTERVSADSLGACLVHCMQQRLQCHEDSKILFPSYVPFLPLLLLFIDLNYAAVISAT